MPEQRELAPLEAQSQSLSHPAIIQSEQRSMMEVITAAASDPRMDPERLTALLALYERLQAKEAEAAFNAALARLQPVLPRITKAGKIDLGKGRPIAYAKYEDIDEAIRPLLNGAGFCVTFGTEPTDKGLLVRATLAHSGGHSRSESILLPPDDGRGRNALQAIGSALTYGKRYLLCGMLNIVTEGEDNDGATIGFIDERQVNTILDLIAAAELSLERQSAFLAKVGHAKTVSEIKKSDYPACVQSLNAAIRQNQEDR